MMHVFSTVLFSGDQPSPCVVRQFSIHGFGFSVPLSVGMPVRAKEYELCYVQLVIFFTQTRVYVGRQRPLGLIQQTYGH